MSRLTEQKNGEIYLKETGYKPCGDVCKSMGDYDRSCDLCPIDEAFKKLAHYEDLEEQGRLIELPCKIGDTVYEVQEIRKRIQEYTVVSVHHSHCSTLFGWMLKDEKGVYSNLNGFEEHAIGRTVFLNREAAEAKLAEVKGK